MSSATFCPWGWSDGLFDRFPVDDVHAIHDMSSRPVDNFALRSRPIMACEDTFEIVIQGTGTHAALPHLGVSVTDFHVDGTRNAIPGRVVLKGDARSFGPEHQAAVEAAMARIVGEHVVGADRVDRDYPAVMTSEDFGFMLQRKPGCYLLLGNGGGPGVCGLHSSSYDFDDANLEVGMAFWVRLDETQLAGTTGGSTP
ncbi:MAG: M20/M25/M40 family metallo-hydrolase [Ilumatobacteraceae bacterium]